MTRPNLSLALCRTTPLNDSCTCAGDRASSIPVGVARRRTVAPRHICIVSPPGKAS